MNDMNSFPSQFEAVLNRNGLVATKFSGWWSVWSRNGNREGALLTKGHRLTIIFPPKDTCSRDIPDMTCCVYDEYEDDVDLFLYFGDEEPLIFQADYEVLEFIKDSGKPTFSLFELENVPIHEKSPRVTYDGTHPSQIVKASGNLHILPDGLEFRSVDYLGNRRWLFLSYDDIKGSQFVMNKVTTIGMMALAKATADRILKPRLVVVVPSSRGELNNIRFMGNPKLLGWAEKIKTAQAFYRERIKSGLSS
jgi:hypothetical protein